MGVTVVPTTQGSWGGGRNPQGVLEGVQYFNVRREFSLVPGTQGAFSKC